MRKLLLATFNPGKVREYKWLLRGLPLKILTLKQLKIKEKFEERGKTFKENAIAKAKFYSRLTGLPTIAEDSGLEIDILRGEPGVRSRRWPGYEAKDKELIDFTLKKLKGVPWQKRKAQLRTVLALAIPSRGKTSVFLFEGKIRGVIAREPKGRLIPGYPFRPIFYLPKIKKTFAELGLKKEIKIGQRKKAVKKLIPILKKMQKVNLDFNFSKLFNLTSFERKVLKEVEKIPYGKTRTYQEIAQAISKPKAVRSVARAISKNPFPLIIPCHRVVGKKDIGGYIFGRKIKKYLLESENGKIFKFQN
jgi:XTP/dITP diphosphohydrolase